MHIALFTPAPPVLFRNQVGICSETLWFVQRCQPSRTGLKIEVMAPWQQGQPSHEAEWVSWAPAGGSSCSSLLAFPLQPLISTALSELLHVSRSLCQRLKPASCPEAKGRMLRFGHRNSNGQSGQFSVCGRWEMGYCPLLLRQQNGFG